MFCSPSPQLPKPHNYATHLTLKFSSTFVGFPPVSACLLPGTISDKWIGRTGQWNRRKRFIFNDIPLFPDPDAALGCSCVPPRVPPASRHKCGTILSTQAHREREGQTVQKSVAEPVSQGVRLVFWTIYAHVVAAANTLTFSGF